MDEEPAYLRPDFDPNSLKVAELRGLLLEYNVDYPSTAKKAVLVDLFNEHIASRAQRIADERSRVRASSRGIVSVDRQGNALIAEPRRGSRRVRRKSVGDTDSDAAGEDMMESGTTPPVKKTPAKITASPSKRLASGRYSRVGTEDGGEPEAPRTLRKSRRSSSRPADLVPETPATPAPQAREQAQELDDEPEQSPFSMENVFQKSPTSASKEGRRKTMQPRTEERTSSRPGRRLTDFLPSSTTGEAGSEESHHNHRVTGGPMSTKEEIETPVGYNHRTTGGTFDTVTRPSTKRYEVPLSRLQGAVHMPVVSPDRAVVKIEKIEDDVEDLIPAGEEFTPEGAQEVAEAEQESWPIAPRRPERRRRTTTPAPASMLWAVIATLLIAYFVWWRKEKIEIGYCGVGNTAPKGLKMTHHDDRIWDTLLRPECEPCPPNAICKPNFTADCKSDYVLVNNPLSFWGLIPLPPTCEPDSEKLRRIAILSDEAIKVLRKRAADVECGEIAPIIPSLGRKEGEAGKEGEEGKEGAGPVVKLAEGGPLGQGKGMEESELHKILYEMKAPKLSDEQFNELFKAALDEVASREEIEAKEDSQTNRLILASASLAAIPLTCSIRLSLFRTVSNYRLELIAVFTAVIAIYQINNKIRQRRENSELVTKYVHVVFRLLARKADQAYRSGRDEDAAVPVVQMRDQVMQHEFDPERRKKVWEGVQGVVEHNSNVRAMSREVRGEVFRVWTWIGSLGVLEDSPRDRMVLGGLGDGVVKREPGATVKDEEWERQIEFPRIVA